MLLGCSFRAGALVHCSVSVVVKLHGCRNTLFNLEANVGIWLFDLLFDKADRSGTCKERADVVCLCAHHGWVGARQVLGVALHEQPQQVQVLFGLQFLPGN